MVGLTASIGVGKSRTDVEAVEYILRVCACLDVRLISRVERNLAELKKHINMPDEGTVLYCFQYVFIKHYVNITLSICEPLIAKKN